MIADDSASKPFRSRKGTASDNSFFDSGTRRRSCNAYNAHRIRNMSPALSLPECAWTLKRDPHIPRSSKMTAIARVKAGESVASVSRSLNLKRQDLYRWKSLNKLGHERAFSGRATG